jgi:sugar transferase (PEP-CTERM/EpsH1 system associated)
MHVVYTLRPGGMEYGVLKLVNGLAGGPIQSSICSTTPAGEIKALVDPRVRLFELRRRPGSDLGFVRDLYRLFRRERPDIVHTHAWGTLLEGLVAARLARIPVVVHGEHGTLQLRGYQKRLQRFAWGRADRVLSVSSRLADRMARETGFPADRIHTIRNGVDLSRFGSRSRDAARRTVGIPPDALVVGTVGRLVPVKDQRTLIEAAARLRQSGVHLTVVIAGDGPLRSDLETAAQALGIADRVRLLGHFAEIETVLSSLDVFALPSVSEGLSNTILEAMASGIPVVATRVGGAEELVADEETGLLVPAGDAEAMAAAIGSLLADPARRSAMGRAARARAKTGFSLPSVLQRYEQMYLQLYDAARARSSGPPSAGTAP